MTGRDTFESSDGETGSMVVAAVLFLGIGYLFGADIEGDKKVTTALNWAIKTTKRCEISYRTDGFPSVADCLKGTIAKAEEEVREEKRAEGYDPRR
jgi:hypothetical protein